MNWLMKKWQDWRVHYMVSPDWHQSSPRTALVNTLSPHIHWICKKAALAIILAITTKKCVKRKWWTKEWLLKRDQYTHLNLLNEIRTTSDDVDYANYFHMKDDCFDELLRMVKPFLKKEDTIMRKSISPEDKLAVTLQYFATGRKIEDLKFCYYFTSSYQWGYNDHLWSTNLFCNLIWRKQNENENIRKNE